MKGYPTAASVARRAGIDWADREAEALDGPPTGPWLPITLDACPLVEHLGTFEEGDLAQVCNGAASVRWADLVGMAEAEGMLTE